MSPDNYDEISEKTYCRNCGKVMDETSGICKFCGINNGDLNIFREYEKIYISNPPGTCPNCGKDLASYDLMEYFDSYTCGYCRVSIYKRTSFIPIIKTCPLCNASTEYHDTYCRFCGSPLDVNSEEFKNFINSKKSKEDINSDEYEENNREFEEDIYKDEFEENNKSKELINKNIKPIEIDEEYLKERFITTVKILKLQKETDAKNYYYNTFIPNLDYDIDKTKQEEILENALEKLNLIKENIDEEYLKERFITNVKILKLKNEPKAKNYYYNTFIPSLDYYVDKTKQEEILENALEKLNLLKESDLKKVNNAFAKRNKFKP